MRIGPYVIETYKRRVPKLDEDVWVYRNLMRTDGPWYSLMQRGSVVGHTRSIALADARFVVRAGGRERARLERVKNVHAFVVGRLAPADCVIPNGTATLRYNPFSERAGFTNETGDVVAGASLVWLWQQGCCARGLRLAQNGMPNLSA